MNGNYAFDLKLLAGLDGTGLPPRILLVCNNACDQETLGTELMRRSYGVHYANTAGEALEAYQDVNLILLGPDLPDLECTEICYKIRKYSKVPVIVISDRDDELDCVLTLQAGADDYVVKPYRLNELIARIQSTLRRIGYQLDTNSLIDCGPLCIDVRGRQTTLDGTVLALTRKEFDLLCLLASNPGVVVPKETIKKKVWGDTWSLRTIDTHVNSLRRKLGRREWIVTVRGVGFMMAEA
ncbi:MAG: DNA-binding response regulator [Pseudonocardiales bacterium]|nr:MAG: DNA-binding response regulator [Pseudonocardiales bacterium]